VAQGFFLPCTNLEQTTKPLIQLNFAQHSRPKGKIFEDFRHIILSSKISVSKTRPRILFVNRFLTRISNFLQ